MNEPPNQSLQWIAASRRPLSFIVGLSPLPEKCLARVEGASGFLQSQRSLFDASGENLNVRF